jgi:hypothetical protein
MRVYRISSNTDVDTVFKSDSSEAIMIEIILLNIDPNIRPPIYFTSRLNLFKDLDIATNERNFVVAKR